MKEQGDRRDFHRVLVDLRADVRGETGDEVRCDVFDLSMSGIFLRCSERFPVGTRCAAKLVLLEGSPGIEMEGRVTRVHDEGMAVEITKINAENAKHLKNLIAYNTRRSDVF